MLRAAKYLILTSLLSGIPSINAQSMTPTTISSTLPADVHLIGPSDAGNQPRFAAIQSVAAQLPVGSFLLINPYDRPIMSIVVQWTLTTRSGKNTTTRLNCSGFLTTPAISIGDPNEAVLLTPRGCMREVLFPRLATRAYVGQLLNDPSRAAAISADVAKVTATVDSVIYQDGTIIGPDQLNYKDEVKAMDQARRSLYSELQGASDERSRAAVLNNAIVGGRSARTQVEILKSTLASRILSNPNQAAAIDRLANASALPAFHQGGM